MKEVIGAKAYVSEDNLEACGEGTTLIARTNTAVVAAAQAELEEGFSFNKDAKMLQCPAGELAMREQCKVGKGKTHSYSIIQVNEQNKVRPESESSEIFQERMRITKLSMQAIG